MMKKQLCVSLFLLTFLTGLLSGCADKNGGVETSLPADGGSKQAQSEADYPAYLNKPGEYPIVNNPVTFTVFTSATAQGTDFEYEKNAFTKWLTDKSNIHLNFSVVNASDEQEKLRLMITGNDYPDLLLRPSFTLSEQQIYGAQGILLPVSEMIDKYCVNIPEMFESYPLAKETYTLNDGKMYAIPAVNDCYHCAVIEKMWVYQPWLAKLEIGLPQTTEEYYEMLVKFRDSDPNGNGKKDEIAYAGSPKGWNSTVEGFLMQPFSKTDTYVDNGKIQVGYVSDGYREGLRYLKKLYAEGLMAPESLTQDGEQLKQLGSSPTHLLGSATGGYAGTITVLDDEGDWKNWVSIPALTGPSGRRECLYNPYENFYGGFSITDKCQYPEAAIRLADLMVDREATVRNTNGVEGVDWEWVTDPTVKGVNGKPAIYRRFNQADPEKNSWWDQKGLTYRSTDLRLGTVADAGSDLETILYKESEKNYYPYIPKDDELFPQLAYNEAEATELAMYESPIKEYRQEMSARFITGESDIDSDADWDSYKTELYNMGLSNMLSIYQATYDLKYGN